MNEKWTNGQTDRNPVCQKDRYIREYTDNLYGASNYYDFCPPKTQFLATVGGGTTLWGNSNF